MTAFFPERRKSLASQMVPDMKKVSSGARRLGLMLALQRLRNAIRKHLRAQHQIRIRGVLAPVMADAVDRWHEHHGGGELAGKPLRVVPRTARHAHVLAGRVAL